MTTLGRFWIALLVMGLAPQPAVPDAVADGSAEQTVAQRLAGEYVRAAQRLLVLSELPSRECIDAAIVLIEEAIFVQPDDVDVWRRVRAIAELAERDDLRAKAIEQISRLDPHDQTIRLMRINQAIEKSQLAEDRVARYQALLRPEVRSQLNPALASRLALDLALLQRRRGDTDEFARWLSEAVTIDPSNHAAVALAVGFFRVNVSDPFAEAELLASLVQANPTDDPPIAGLAQLALEQGAYKAASKLYLLAMEARSANAVPLFDGQLTDLVIATWASGDDAEALKYIADRQQGADYEVQMEARLANPKQLRDHWVRLRGDISEALATTRAAILHAQGDPGAAAALDTAIEIYGKQLARALAAASKAAVDSAGETQPPDSNIVAGLALQPVWLALWLGEDAARAESLVAKAEQLSALSEGARGRFDGWLAFRRGDLASAEERLTPLAEGDFHARLGLGLTLMAQGRRSEGAAHLLAVAREQTGTIVGIWTEEYLRKLLGMRPPKSETARKIERLIDSFPRALFDFPRSAGQAVSLKLVPVTNECEAYEPILVNLEVTNRTAVPLAIDARGPIRPQVIINSSIRLPRLPNYSEGPVMVVDINRRLRLEPRQTLSITLDLRRTELNDVINALPFSGATIQLTAISNFMVGPNGLKVPLMLGDRAESPIIRVNGARVTVEWVRQSIELLRQPDGAQRLGLMALLGNVVSAGMTTAETPEQRSVAEEAVALLIDMYSRLDPMSQAWLLAVFPPSPELEPIAALARQSRDRHVLMQYLMRRVEVRSDPMLDAAKRSDDAALVRLATLLDDVLALREQLSAQRAVEEADRLRKQAERQSADESAIPAR